MQSKSNNDKLIRGNPPGMQQIYKDGKTAANQMGAGVSQVQQLHLPLIQTPKSHKH